MAQTRLPLPEHHALPEKARRLPPRRARPRSTRPRAPLPPKTSGGVVAGKVARQSRARQTGIRPRFTREKRRPTRQIAPPTVLVNTERPKRRGSFGSPRPAVAARRTNACPRANKRRVQKRPRAFSAVAVLASARVATRQRRSVTRPRFPPSASRYHVPNPSDFDMTR